MSALDFVPRLVALPLPSEPIASAGALRRLLETHRPAEDTVELAALGGLAAGSVGWAFAGGYQMALARLDPDLAHGARLASLCATEEGGGHPRAIRTVLARAPDGRWTVTGRKAFVTMGSDADVLLVVATTGEDTNGRNTLKVVRLPSTRAGIAVRPLEPLPFAPDIGHAVATFDRVAAEDGDVLSGDGYDLVLKPFRTIEDTHVMAAILGWTIRVGRLNRWARIWIEEALALVMLMRVVNASTELRPVTHLTLAGALAATRSLLDRAPWEATDASARAGWERDRRLLDVASSVRVARSDAAWQALL